MMSCTETGTTGISITISSMIHNIGFCLIFLVLGILRFQISEFNIANDKLSKFNGKGQVVLTGIISDEPDVRDTSQKIEVKVADSIILVTTKRYPDIA